MESRITVRMTDKMIAQIDAWIASQSGYVSRQEAVRRLVAFSLEQADAPIPLVRGLENRIHLAGVRRRPDDAGS